MGILNLIRRGEDGSWSLLVEAMVTKETGDLTGMHEEKRGSLSSSEGARLKSTSMEHQHQF